MPLILFVFIAFIYFIGGNYYANAEKKCTSSQSCGSTPLAFASSWIEDPDNCPVDISEEHAGITSQQGPETSSTYYRRNGATTSGELWLDVWQLQEAQEQERMVLRSLRCSMGRLHCVPAEEIATIEIEFEKGVVLDSPTQLSMGRSTWRQEPEATAQKESWQRKRQSQRTQRPITTGAGAPSTTTNCWSRRASTTMDDYAFTAWCSNILSIRGIITSGTKTEGSIHPAEEGQSRVLDSRTATICRRRDQGCDQEGRQDALHCSGCPDKSKGRTGHSPPCQEQPHVTVESLPDYVAGKIQAVHRSLSESGKCTSRKYQERQRQAPEGQRRFQLERRGSYSDLRRRGRCQGYLDEGIGQQDLGGTCPYDGEPSKAVRAGRTGASGRGKEGKKAAPKGRRTKRCCDAARKLTIAAAFWCARSLMTLEYFDRWAPWPDSTIAADVAALQWSHSILQEPIYKSPWQASEDALQLAFEMQPDSLVAQCEKREWGFYVSHKKHQKGLTVSFDPFAQIHSGPEFSPTWTSSRVPTAGNPHREQLPKCSNFSQSFCTNFDDHTAEQPILTLSCRAPRMHRPDLTENPNFPDPPSSSDESDGHRRPGRVPIRHLPAWVESLWNILQDEGATELLEEGPVIYLSTYYLSHRNCVRQAVDRPIRLTRRYEEWIEEFKQVWGDMFDREADFNVYLVQPEPPISITRGIVGIVLIVQHAQPEGAAVLTTALFDELPTPRTLEIAHVVDIWTDYSTALRRAEAFEACREAERQNLRPCVLRAGPHVFPRERPIRMHDGLGLVVNVPMLINEEEWNVYIRPRMEHWQDIADVLQPENEVETDHTAMMARRPRARTPLSSSSSTSATDSMQTSSSREPSSGMRTWTRTVVFTVDGNAASCLLPDEHHQEFHRRIAIAIGHEEIAEIYTVLDRPDDLVAVELQCLLALRSGERRPVSFLRLTLLDLEIIEANEILPGIFRRLAKWLPHTMSITSLFRILSIENVFRRHEAKTSIWLNNVVIDPRREDPIVIEDGDYVKIFIGDDDQRFQCPEQSEETMLLQQSAAITAKVGDKQITQHTRLDCCDREIGLRPRVPRAPAQAEEDEPDLRHLHDIWNRPHLQTQGPDREPIMYFDTWFLSALDFPRCSTPRSVALPAHVQLWDNALRQVWRDRQHPHWPIRMQLIFPTPVGAPNGGHLLILQHEHPAEAGILLTISGGPAQDRFAQLVPSMLPFDRLLWFADQEVRCVQRDWICHATHNQQRIPTNNPWRAENGQHIELHVKARAIPASSSTHEVPAPRPAVPPAAEKPNDSIDDFVFDPLAPVFIPGEVRLEHMPEVIQDLHEECGPDLRSAGKVKKQVRKSLLGS